jgi:hypothetical protein
MRGRSLSLHKTFEPPSHLSFLLRRNAEAARVRVQKMRHFLRVGPHTNPAGSGLRVFDKFSFFRVNYGIWTLDKNFGPWTLNFFFFITLTPRVESCKSR